jgi:hypothetical protein
MRTPRGQPVNLRAHAAVKYSPRVEYVEAVCRENLEADRDVGVQIKAQYDPDNFVRLNPNIAPASVAAR